MITPTMGTVWVVYTVLTGHLLPTIDSPQFTTERACQIFLASYGEEIVDTLKLVCSQK